MRKGVDGFENVTAIHNRSMEGPAFVFEKTDGQYAIDTLRAWRMMTLAHDLGGQIIDGVSPLLDPRTQAARIENMRRIKRLSIIEREEELMPPDDAALETIHDVLDSLEEASPAHNAVYLVTMMHRAQVRSQAEYMVDPLPIVERIVRQAEERTA